MQQGRGGMGSHKHGISGKSGKSPKLRHHLKREAEKNDKQPRIKTDWKQRIKDLFKLHK